VKHKKRRGEIKWECGRERERERGREEERNETE
jgi:hypothetical protein